jgi:hypothetical protein
MNESEDQIFPLGGQVPVGRKIALEFDSFRDFISEFSPLVSEDGMFVGEGQLAGESSLAAGDPVQFEVRLSKEFWLIRGSGEIAWRRGSDDPTGPPGVAVRFKSLDEPSQRLVGRLVSNRVKEGGALFDLETVPRPAPTPPVVPEPVREVEAEGGVPESRVEQEPPIFSVKEPFPETVDAGAVFSADSIPELPEVPAADAIESETGRPEGIFDIPGPGEPMPLPESPQEPLPQELDEPVGEEEIDVPVVTHSEIAQMAEEISGVTTEVGPEGEEEESSSVMAARAAAVKSERSPWLWLAVASLVGVAVGVVFFFYFGRIKALFVAEEEMARSVAVVESPAETADAAPVAEESGISESEAPDSTPAELSAEGAAEEGIPAKAPAAELAEAVPDAETVAQLPPATRVNRITWREQDGGTAVVVHLNGGLSEKSYEVMRVRGGAPREVVKIIGIGEPFRPPVLEVGDSRIQQIRTGLHQTERGSELHIVVDLASPETAVKRTRIREKTLVLVFS